MWFNFTFKPVEITGFFVYEGIVQFEEERIGTVICDLGQSSTLAF